MFSPPVNSGRNRPTTLGSSQFNTSGRIMFPNRLVSILQCVHLAHAVRWLLYFQQHRGDVLSEIYFLISMHGWFATYSVAFKKKMYFFLKTSKLCMQPASGVCRISVQLLYLGVRCTSPWMSRSAFKLHPPGIRMPVFGREIKFR